MTRLTALVFVFAVGALSCAGKTTHTSVATSSSAPPSSSTAPAESAAPVENNPPGDIPDTQAFVEYRSTAGGYHLQVPEGWARTEKASSVVFSDKLHSVGVDIESASGPRSVDTVRSMDEPKIRSSVRAFQEMTVQAVTLPSGPGVLLRYRANSEPNQVTGKVYRLEVDRYEMYRNGKLASLSLSATAGSDNVDVWKKISDSFGWSA
jgi:hypothetical protein